MTEWGVVGVIIAVVGLFFTVGKPVINLNTSITKLTVTVDRLQKDYDDLKKRAHEEVSDLEDVMGKLDILYMTRVQRERFFNEEDYVRLKDCYILTSKKMAAAKPDMAVLHPLPRVNEIATEVDSDPRAAYFKQAQYGVYVRMALIATLLNLAGREPEC